MKKKMIFSGNEAVARGCYEHGLHIATAYPGTPSTEILENVSKYPEIYSEWSPNEKVAFEVAMGATFEGARTLVAMKHVGLNVAADAFMSMSFIGAPGGFLVVTADDPGMHSSQNEQDNRYYAKFAEYPCIEPSDSQEAKDFVGLGLDLSIEFDTPVMYRLTTRVCHGKSIVELGERTQYPITGFKPNPKKFVVLPSHGREMHPKVMARIARIKEWAETTPLNRIEKGSNGIGIITHGATYNFVKEVMPDASVLKLGMTYPLPINMIKDFAKSVDKLFVIEELEPFIENLLKIEGIECEGMKFWSNLGELTPEIVAAGLEKAGVFKSPYNPKEKESVIPRPPIFCPGCPHRGLYHSLRKNKAVVTTDIGCYTLGCLEPLGAGDTCVEMGASIGVGVGMAKARKSGKGIVATIGDSTFLHSGITGLLNAVNDKAGITVVIADNSITAMTGGQQHPGSGETLTGAQGYKVNLAKICQAVGADNIKVIDPYNLEQTRSTLKEAMESDELSVIITNRPCALYPAENRKLVQETPFAVDHDKCIGCHACFKVSCPAISESDQKTAKGLTKSQIDSALCTGCSVCAQVCPVNAIERIK
ncbi:indolepyruvate ferredoxin oxidoreductase subunit alpha [bacterium]|nr:indolepyruvate ferredoxin oxidoreductase subunit alpha [bacterium]